MAGRFLIICAVALLCASCGPRMNRQISVQPYKQRMPTMPVGTVPTTGHFATGTVPAAGNVKDGRIYYGYYCLMCHGEKGDGNGPVGESYVPKPADLTAPATAGLSDDQLTQRMLHGNGHDPIMSQTVLPEYRQPLVAYVRQLRR